MTYKKYSDMKIFCYDMKQVFSRSYGILLLGLLFLALLIPFSTAGLPGNSIFNVEVTHQQMKFRFFLTELSWTLNFALVLFGLLLGIFLFRFLLDKKQSTTFFSLGLSRYALFCSRFFVGLLMIVTVVFIPMIVSLGLNLSALGNYTGLWESFWYLSFGMILLTTVSFSVSAISCIFAGTLLEAICFGTALLSSISALSYITNALMKKLLWGNPFGVSTYSETSEIADNLLETFASYNPILFFHKQLTEHGMFYRSLTQAEPSEVSWLFLVLWCLVAVLLFVLAMYLFEHRKAEQAGISGLNMQLSGWSIFIAGLLTFTVLFCFLADYQIILAIIIAAFGFAFVYWVCSFLLLGRYVNRKHQFAFFFGEFAVVMILTGIIGSGFFGFDSRLPETADITEVNCSYIGSPNYLYKETSGISSGTQYYFTCDYSYDSQEEIEQVRQIHSSFIESGKCPMTSTEKMINTVLPYDIKFEYTMNNGKTITRYYNRASVAQLSALLELDNTDTVKNGRTTAIKGEASTEESVVWSSEAYAHGQIYLADKYYANSVEIRLSDDKRQQLLNAIAADVSSQNTADIYTPSETAMGVILFSQDGENSKETFSYQLENTMIYLNKSYTNTISFLSENNLTQYLEFKGEIESITLQKYNPYAGINSRKTPVSNYFMGHIGSTLDEFWVQEDFGEKYTVTQSERLLQIIPNLQNGYFLNDEGYLAAVKLAGEERYAYLYLPENRIPDFLKK